jgi:hypothetical protein
MYSIYYLLHVNNIFFVYIFVFPKPELDVYENVLTLH